jgi:ligand-binding SRPBCC domain-containing protein
MTTPKETFHGRDGPQKGEETLMGRLYRIHRSQRLPIDLEAAWDFFSDSRNLARITPAYLGFSFVGEPPEKMYEGMIITYKIRPVFGIPITWVTEITHVDKPSRFVDEQRFGPYRFWHHKHLFRPIQGGVEMEDIVDYAMPFGPLGSLPHAFLVRRRLEGIFDYREGTLRRMFGEIP